MIADSYKRWRHGRGFGIHSPFAFTLITDYIFARKVAFYGYDDIRDTLGASDSPALRRKARMLLRLAVALNPGSVFLPEEAHPVFHAALLAADSRTRIYTNPEETGRCRLLLAKASAFTSAVFAAHVAKEGNILCIEGIDSTLAATLRNAIPQGLILWGKHNAIFINRSHTALTEYTLKI